MTKGKKPGDVLVRWDVDPYFRSFRNSSTHILAAKLDEASLRAALKAGRAFVAHDWMGDATGFRFTANNPKGERVALMGDEVKLGDGLKLSAELPLPAYIRLLHHGKEVAKGGAATVFGKASGAAPADAALINGGLIHSLEFDDTHTASIALHSAKRPGIQPGDLVASVGSGGMGLLVAMCAKTLGAARVIVVGGGKRLDRARELGFETVGHGEVFRKDR